MKSSFCVAVILDIFQIYIVTTERVGAYFCLPVFLFSVMFFFFTDECVWNKKEVITNCFHMVIKSILKVRGCFVLLFEKNNLSVTRQVEFRCTEIIVCIAHRKFKCKDLSSQKYVKKSISYMI